MLVHSPIISGQSVTRTQKIPKADPSITHLFMDQVYDLVIRLVTFSVLLCCVNKKIQVIYQLHYNEEPQGGNVT